MGSLKGLGRDFVAAVACPFSGLREGIRWVPMRDWAHHAIELCGLLVLVRMKGPWADVRCRQRQNRVPLARDVARKTSKNWGGLDDTGGSGGLVESQFSRPSFHMFGQK